MPLPSSGQIAIDQIGTEFLSAAPYSLSQFYRGGGKVADSPQNVNVPASGQVSFSNFYGAQLRSVNNLLIASNTNNYDVMTALGSAYFPSYTDVTVTINSGVTVGSASQASPAMTVSGFVSGDTVSIVNNGTISGAGGPGGRGTNTVTPNNAVAGTQGGSALSVSFATSVTNNGTIAGGGGGGGGGSGRRYTSGKTSIDQGGGGGGGGAGTIVGAAGALGTGESATYNGLAGAAGTASAGGAGGAAKNSAGAGGAGGALGAAGSTGTTGSATVRGTAAAGGATGSYIVGNANVTWVANGTRLGSVA